MIVVEAQEPRHCGWKAASDWRMAGLALHCIPAKHCQEPLRKMANMVLSRVAFPCQALCSDMCTYLAPMWQCKCILCVC